MLVAGAALRVPMVAVILRRGYGLGAQAMAGGSLHEPLLTVAWPGAHLGPMGLRERPLGLPKSSTPSPTPPNAEEVVRRATASAQDKAQALNAAMAFEIDDVIDPAETRGLVPRPWRGIGARPPATGAPVRRHLVSHPLYAITTLVSVLMTPRSVIALAVGVGLVFNSGAGIASAATVQSVYQVQGVAVPAWFAGLHLDAATAHPKTHCGDGT